MVVARQPNIDSLLSRTLSTLVNADKSVMNSLLSFRLELYTLCAGVSCMFGFESVNEPVCVVFGITKVCLS